MSLLRHHLAPCVLACAVALPAGAAGDAAAGGLAFVQCADCHSTRSGNGTGPGLLGVVGRRAGTHPGFDYSPAMTRSGLTWDAKTLDAYLAGPKTVVPGTTMDFPGVTDPAERADLVAYLATLK